MENPPKTEHRGEKDEVVCETYPLWRWRCSGGIFPTSPNRPKLDVSSAHNDIFSVHVATSHHLFHSHLRIGHPVCWGKFHNFTPPPFHSHQKKKIFWIFRDNIEQTAMSASLFQDSVPLHTRLVMLFLRPVENESIAFILWNLGANELCWRELRRFMDCFGAVLCHLDAITVVLMFSICEILAILVGKDDWGLNREHLFNISLFC